MPRWVPFLSSATHGCELWALLSQLEEDMITDFTWITHDNTMIYQYSVPIFIHVPISSHTSSGYDGPTVVDVILIPPTVWPEIATVCPKFEGKPLGPKASGAGVKQQLVTCSLGGRFTRR